MADARAPSSPAKGSVDLLTATLQEYIVVLRFIVPNTARDASFNANHLVRNSQSFAPYFGRDFNGEVWARIRGGYAKEYKIGLSLMKSMVPAGGIEPTA
jgi:hypothetical protein